MQFDDSRAFAKTLDEKHVLSSHRDKFLIPEQAGEEAIYFLGNSLGLQPKTAKENMLQVLQQWNHWGVEAFFKGHQPWMDFHAQLQPTLATIVGALPQEVVVMNQLTVNLHLMLASFYQPNGKRRKILCEAKAFPSDQYMLQTHIKQRGFAVDDIIIEVAPRNGEVLIKEEDIIAAIEKNKDELALVFWGGINYYTGQLFNIQSITNAGHAAGAKVGFDLAHAAGNVALQLHDWNVDFACWCNYKYLNSGPGAVAGAYIQERYHKEATINRLGGWWGNNKKTQFVMHDVFDPEPSAEGWQLSTPSPVLFAACKSSLQIFEDAGVENVFEKNKQLTKYLWQVLQAVMAKLPEGLITIITPSNEKERGCQVSLKVKNGKQVFDELTAQNIFADWREPDVIRVAPVSLYNTYEEVWRFGEILEKSFVNKNS